MVLAPVCADNGGAQEGRRRRLGLSPTVPHRSATRSVVILGGVFRHIHLPMTKCVVAFASRCCSTLFTLFLAFALESSTRLNHQLTTNLKLQQYR